MEALWFSYSTSNPSKHCYSIIVRHPEELWRLEILKRHVFFPKIPEYEDKGRLHFFVLSEVQLAPAFLKKVPYCASSACTRSPVTSHSELVIVPVNWTPLPFSFSFIFMSLVWFSRNTQQTCKHVLRQFCSFSANFTDLINTTHHPKHIWSTYEEHMTNIWSYM